MISLSEVGGLYKSIPANLKDARTKAFADACDKQIKKLIERAEKIKVWCAIETVDEKYLDYLAVDYRVLFYHSGLAVTVKRNLIRNSIYWYMRLGTTGVVTELLTEVFGHGEIQEWFEYGGEPYHFRVNLKNVEVHHGQNGEFRQLLEEVKRLNAQLDEIQYIFNYVAEQMIQYDVSLCMTSVFYPRYNTPPHYLEGVTRLDGRYFLNGYLSGQSFDFYLLALQVGAGAEWRTASAEVVDMQMRFCPWVWQLVGNTADLGIWGAMYAQVHPEGRFYLSWETGIKVESAGQAEIQSSAVQAVEHGVSMCAAGGVEVPRESQVDALRVSGTAGGACGTASESRLVIEKDLWRLDGRVALDGSRILNAKIYEEEI